MGPALPGLLQDSSVSTKSRAHNSQKYPVDTALGGQESGARAQPSPRVESWAVSGSEHEEGRATPEVVLVAATGSGLCSIVSLHVAVVSNFFLMISL